MNRRKFVTITLPLTVMGNRALAATSAEPEFSFGVIADPQYADVDPVGSRFYRNSLEKLEKAVAELNRSELSFVVTLGDLIDRDLKSFDAVMPIYEKLKHPHFPICGNHDFEVADADKGEVLKKMKLENGYYSKVFKGWRFIFLDGTDVSIYRHPANDPRTAEARKLQKSLLEEGAKHAQSWNGGVGSEQAAWLEKELTAARSMQQRVVLLNHFPVFPEGNHNLWNSAEIVALIGKNDHIVAYLNGHKHAGNYATHQGCHFMNFKGMVETESETAYAKVRCFTDRLEIQGYGLEPDRKLEKL